MVNMEISQCSVNRKRVKSCLRVCFPVFMFIEAFLFLAVPMFTLRQQTMKHVGDNQTIDEYLIDTPGCRIRKMDPYDSSILKFIYKHKPIVCGNRTSITYVDGNVLRLNQTTITEFYEKEFKHCKYTLIKRKDYGPDTFYYGENQTVFHHDVIPKDEFLRVDCCNESNHVIYSNYHAFVLDKPKLEKKLKIRYKNYLEKYNPAEKLSVMVVGIDSVSRLNFIRQMTKTRKYLLDTLEATELLGYNKVADNTFVNVVPIFAGKYYEELNWNKSLYFDNCSFIWKNFSSYGFRTLYAEDSPYISAFNYFKKGFSKPPTDYYLRPISLAMDQNKDVWNNHHWCIGDKLETKLVLDYVTDFAKLYKNKPTFSFAYVSRVTHEDMNTAGLLDIYYLKFLRELFTEGLLNNTALFFLSDHGMRYGNARYTFVGMEERMPFSFVIIPKWFRNKYKDIARNLQTNTRRLTTPFDINETLKDILYFKGDAKKHVTKTRGMSLFKEIPPTRSCTDASILEHWCCCFTRTKLVNTTEIVSSSAEFVLSQMNALLKPYEPKCSVLRLSYILDAHSLWSKGENVTTTIFSEFDFVLQMILVTHPGEGMFETTLSKTSGKFLLLGDISRINLYGNQSRCINDFILKKYCYCR